MKINDNYSYIVSVDQWALIEYFKAKKINLERLRDIKGDHLLILSLIVGFYLNEKLITKTFKGLDYTWMSNTLFYDNIPVMFIRKAITKKEKKREELSLKRNLQNYLTRLIDLGIIHRIIENESTRFLRVDEVFLTKCNRGKVKLSPLDFVNKYHKKEFYAIKKEYEMVLPYSRYPALESKFFDNEHFNQYMNKDFTIDKQYLFSRFRMYLDECVKDPYYKIKGV
jgi:hypothetical protein